MTLLFERTVDGPATHAFIVGCGRYPHMGVARSADRRAPVAGALAMTAMLLAKQDSLAAPLGTLELLVSDPSTAGPLDIGERLTRVLATQVDAADEAHFRESGERWLDRVRPGDVLIFYFSGHGIADRIGGAVGLLEDVRSSRNRPWAQSFGVTNLALALRTLSAESAWVFIDACQEVVAEFAERLWDVKNIELKEVTLKDVTAASCEPLVLAGARTGQVAWAPGGDEPPFFTQVLLKGLSGCCVERTRERGWAVTGKTLLFDLADVGETVVDEVRVEPQSLTAYSDRKILLIVDRPFTPVMVRSKPEVHLNLASTVRLMHGSVVLRRCTSAGFAWKLDVEFEERELTIECETRRGAPMIASQTFRQRLPAHNIVLVPVEDCA